VIRGRYYIRLSSDYVFHGSRYSVAPASNWDDGRQIAMQLGGDYVIINTEEEQRFLAGHLPTQSQYWIGLYDPESDGTFVWLNGDPVGYAAWRAGQPSADGQVVSLVGSDDTWNVQSKGRHALPLIERPNDTLRDIGHPGTLGQYLLEVDLRRHRSGDANWDGRVDGEDLTIVLDHLFSDGRSWHTGDFDGDGFTDTADFNLWFANRFTGSGPAAAATPRTPRAPGPAQVPIALSHDAAFEALANLSRRVLAGTDCFRRGIIRTTSNAQPVVSDLALENLKPSVFMHHHRRLPPKPRPYMTRTCLIRLEISRLNEPVEVDSMEVDWDIE
jgi:hypothetical protein